MTEIGQRFKLYIKFYRLTARSKAACLKHGHVLQLQAEVGRDASYTDIMHAVRDTCAKNRSEIYDAIKHSNKNFDQTMCFLSCNSGLVAKKYRPDFATPPGPTGGPKNYNFYWNNGRVQKSSRKSS